MVEWLEKLLKLMKRSTVEITSNVNVIIFRSTIANVLNKNNQMLDLIIGIFFVLMVLIIAIYYVIPNLYGKSEVTALPNFVSKKQVNLGLDLQGGSHLLLEKLIRELF